MELNSLYNILIFIAPGLLVKELHGYFVKGKVFKQPAYEYIFEIVVDSLIVLFFSVVVINYFNKENLSTVESITTYFNDIFNIASFIGIAFPIAVIWCILKYKVIIPSFLKTKNFMFTKLGFTFVHTGKPSTWDSMMEYQDINNTWQVVSVYNHNNYITSGMIEERISSNAAEFELALEYKQDTEKLMKEYPEKFRVWHEYYNINTGLRVLFYNQELLQEHWDKMINK
ncbi:hypothetical protein Ami103574_04270 [Aminipila butyrica]|uniref:Uncharacterized protein n=1 Tax=Aminipila butyrica TaxID=433296 RepID=A0A858BRQ6_9FIRM|nr:hypothetical protein [Aminipila butyrica]QIB68583.1 hypothetical protein Ami103574_04270 [Aminipila butyrica]